MALPDFSLTFTLNVCSGFRTSGITILGSKIVFLSITSTGIIPYILIGESFLVDACGCNKVMLKYTLGAIAAVIGTSTLVSPFLVFAHNVCTTFAPFSIDINARPPSLEGKDICAFSPTA